MRGSTSKMLRRCCNSADKMVLRTTKRAWNRANRAKRTTMGRIMRAWIAASDGATTKGEQ